MAASKAGAMGVIDLEYVDSNGIAELLRAMDGSSVDFGVRVDPMSEKLQSLITGELPDGMKLLVSMPKETIPDMVRSTIYETARSMGLKVFQEVCTVEEAEASSQAGADALILRGREGGGRVSELSTKDLLAEVLKEVDDRPLIVRGGIPLSDLGKARDLGISGLVMDSQLFSTSEASLPEALRELIDAHRSGDTFLVGESIGRPHRFIADDATRSDLTNLEKAMVDQDEDPKTVYITLKESMKELVASSLKGGGGILYPAGEELSEARELESYGGVEEALSDLAPVSATEKAVKDAIETEYTKEGEKLDRSEITVDGMPVPEDYHDRSIAVVGIGSVFPKGIGTDNFWKAVLDGVDASMEVPKDRWDWKYYYDPDRKKPDKTYTKIGAFITDLDMDFREFRLPPKLFEQIDRYQRYAMKACKEALIDSGLIDNSEVDRTRIGVIVSNSGGGENRDWGALRVSFDNLYAWMDEVEEWKNLPQDARVRIKNAVHGIMDEKIIQINEDSMPGCLPNIASGRLANLFNLKGPNFITDAACASSLAAVHTARNALLLDQIDIAVSGGTDSVMTSQSFVEFCKIGALTPDGSRPFAEGANGFLMGEGSGIIILKRLDDAVNDGDKIYGVVRGIGASSDGKAKGITAPNPEGQTLALKNAYADAGVDIDTISFIEAHGTSTAVGDVAELNSLDQFFKDMPNGSIGLTSIKSQIGHLKSAAGAAGMIKSLLAIKNKILPPQINFERPNPYYDWGTSPFFVITEAKEWVRKKEDVPRRCGVSAFGFGGTNFHVILEEFDSEIYEAWKAAKGASEGVRECDEPGSPVQDPGEAGREVDLEGVRSYLKEHQEEEAEYFLFSSDNPLDLLRQAEDSVKKASELFESGGRLRDAFTMPSYEGRYRLGISARDHEHLAKQVEMLKKVGMNEKGLLALAAKGIFVGDRERMDHGKVCFMFPGQGSQYINMFRELRNKFKMVRETFDEADSVMEDLIPEPLSTYVFRDVEPKTPEYKEASETLRRTEFNQPSMLTVDTAMYKLLQRLGVKPDLAMGHSLGEYGALIASGVMDFGDALKAVSARGREMRDLKVDDPGKMASVMAGLDVVEEVISEVDGYVIPANKNCLVQTVIAGQSEAVDQAIRKFEERGIEAVQLPVSHAFHSGVVAPVKDILRDYLSKLTINPPKIPLLSNVTGDYYPMEGDPKRIKEDILDLLKEQVASSVEWISQVERAYADGCRTFIEVGPKRALTSFAYNLMEDEVKKGMVFPITSNHPKKGGMSTFNEMVSFLWSLGFDLRIPAKDDREFFTSEFLDALDGFVKDMPTSRGSEGLGPSESSIPPVVQGATGAPSVSDRSPSFDEFLSSNKEAIDRFLREIHGSVPGKAAIEEPFRDDVDLSGTGTTAPTRRGARVVISGAAFGLPGSFKKVFAEENLDLLVQGRNLIEALTEEQKTGFIDKNIIRLDKKPDGSAEMVKLDDGTKVAQFAGRLSPFDLNEEFGVPESLIDSLDITSQLAFGAGLLSLKDAGIPLVKRYSQTSTGSFLPEDWELPLELQEDTGIIFASAFPGIDRLLTELAQYYTAKIHKAIGKERERLIEAVRKRVKDTELQEEFEALGMNEGVKEYHFPRNFMFRVLAMGHSQFAQYIKAKGPNIHVNSACATSTIAVGIAQDWIQSGRCKRVIVLGADDPASDANMEWFGSSLLAMGALTNEKDIKNAAIPFDERRKGMILGSGVAALVVEAEEEPRRRGMNPIVEVLGSHIGNSAFHGSRLDVAHIARSMDRFIHKMERMHGLKREEIASDMLFMSHETYTPARGGSSAAEVESLRRTFGENFRDIVILNTKGYTGHAFGACLEDPVLVKCLENGFEIPIANLDPHHIDRQFEGMQLSRGGKHDRHYGLRLAAGFGSQLSFLLMKRPDSRDRYISRDRYEAWLRSVATTEPVELEVERNVLRLKDSGRDHLIPHRAVRRESSEIGYQRKIAETVDEAIFREVKEQVVGIFARKMGFPEDTIDIDADLEADLGIDTVKQVELFGAARIHFELPKDEGVNLRDFPTLRHIINYIIHKKEIKSGKGRVAEERRPVHITEEVEVEVDSGDKEKKIEVEAEEEIDRWDQVKDKVVALVSEKTGYPDDMLELDLDLEADLGIDTVKQVELFALAREDFDLPRDDAINLQDLNTLRKIIDYVIEKMGGEIPIREEKKALPSGGTEVEDAAPAREAEPEPQPEPEPEPEHETAPRPSSSQEVWDNAKDIVISLVAEKTGYPEDMLELDLDLEADLGIDTVKQVELFATAREDFSLPKDDSVNLSELNTLRKIIDYVVGKIWSVTTVTEPVQISAISREPAPVVEKAVEKKEPPEASSETGSSDHWENVKTKVIEIVAEKTGYPEDMLELDLDLEADLGIDTVKQVELFAMAREKFNLPRDDSINLTDLNTLRKIIDYVVSTGVAEQREQPSVDEEEEVSVEQLSEEQLKGRINRWVLQSDEAPMLETGKSPVRGRKALIIGGDEGSALVVEEKLGIDAFHIPQGMFDYDEEAIGEIEGIVCISPLFLEADPDPEDWERLSASTSKLLFRTCKSLDRRLKEGGFLYSITGMGGRFALDRSVNPFNGSISGFTKAVGREYPDADVISLDVDPGIGVESACDLLLAEVSNEGHPLEVGSDGIRRYLPAMRIFLPPRRPNIDLVDGMSILVSGGGGGITAEIIKGLAKRAKLKFHIIDIAELLPDTEELSELDEEGLAAKKEEIRKALIDEGKKVTPVMLDREFSRITRSIGVHKLLKELESMGSEPHYHRSDIRDAEAISRIAAEAGRIDGIIHAAGIEQSKSLLSKKEEDFDRVFDIKVQGAKAVIGATRDHPVKFFLTFTSVAGRFGNAGQVDYSSANDTIAKLRGALLKYHPDCIFKAVGWSAWANVGMASRGAVKTLLEMGGITFIPADDGIEYAISEILHGKEREIYYSGSLGPMDKGGILKWSEGIHPPMKEESSPELPNEVDKEPSIPKGPGPLLDEVIENTGTRIHVRRSLDGKRERFLPDHSIMGTMVLPGVMGMELFAETAKTLCSDKEVVELRDIRFKKAVNVKEQLDLFVEGGIESEGDDETIVTLRVYSILRSKKTGKEVQVEHYNGSVVMGTRSRECQKVMDHPLKPRNVLAQVLRPEIYEHLFHGPRFQVLEGMEVLKDGELVGVYRPAPSDMFDPATGWTNSDILTAPMQTECGFQTAGAYVLDRFKLMALPTKVGSIEYHVDTFTSEPGLAWVRFEGREDTTFKFDVDFVDGDGNVRFSFRDYQLKSMMAYEGELKGDHSVHYEEFHSPGEGARVFRIDLDSAPEDLENYVKYFDEEEWKGLVNEKMTQKRRREHTMGRVCAKMAVLWYLATEKYRVVPTRSIKIMTEEGGKPYALAEGKKIEISISHSHRWAVCSVSDSVHGVDIELAEHRDLSFVDEAFTIEEAELIKRKQKEYDVGENVMQTLFFSAKESYLKMKGLGLSVDLRSVQCTEVVKLPNKGGISFEVFVNHGDEESKVQAHVPSAYVLTVCIEGK
ncbi:MAG: SDR family NAD(P)-dependent oxidoreductase [Thermoplasmatota archaeon]